MTRRQCPVCERTTDDAVCPEHAVPTIDPVILGAPPRLPRSGEVVAGRYVLATAIGDGGMAVVYRGRDRKSGRDVAIKFMRPPQRLELRHVKRFWREAHALAEIQHPNVIALHDFGIDESSHLPFLAMEFLDGETLADEVLRVVGTEHTAALQLASVARALEAAHARGFAHRDLKPENVMLARDGRVVVLDFGVAKALRGVDDRITAPGSAVGTPQYMSPEQVRGQEVDARSDLYGLGCILHVILSGRPPFDDDNAHTVMDMHLIAPVPPLPRVLVDGRAPSEPLVRLHAALLAKDPSARPVDATGVAEVLEHLGRGDTASAARRLNAALGAVRARASARAAIAAAPTGHAMPLDGLEGRAGMPSVLLFAPADTAVAPRELERPMDEPSVVRTAPTAWALPASRVPVAATPYTLPPETADTPLDAIGGLETTNASIVRIAQEVRARAEGSGSPVALAAPLEARTLPVTATPMELEPRTRPSRASEVRLPRRRWPGVVGLALGTAVLGAAGWWVWGAGIGGGESVAAMGSPADGVGGAGSSAGGGGSVGPGAVGAGGTAVGAVGVAGPGGSGGGAEAGTSAGAAAVGGGGSRVAVGAGGASSVGAVGAGGSAGAMAAGAVAAGGTPSAVGAAGASGSGAAVPDGAPPTTASAQPRATPAAATPLASPPSPSPSPSPRSRDDRAARRARPEPTSAPAPAAAAAPTVTVTVTSVPPGAQVLRGSTVLGKTPLALRVEAAATYRVVLDGYAERQVVVRPGDSTRAVTLVPLW